MKKGTVIGIVIGLIIALVIGGVFGVMAMRIYMLEDELSEQTVVSEEAVAQDQTPAVQKPQQPAPQPQQPQTQESEHPWVDVETEVSRIRAIYNDTVAGMNAGLYTHMEEGGGVEYYYDGNDLKCMVVSKDAYGMMYSRWFYYENGQLIFAYYENEDAHRFYFYQGDLMRWRYAANAQNAQNAVNEDWGTSEEFCQWERTVLAESGGRGY